MFANIGDLTSNVISSEKNLPLAELVFCSEELTFLLYQNISLTLSSGQQNLNFHNCLLRIHKRF